MTLAHMTLADLGGALSWAALSHFVQHIPRTSALSRELVPKSDAERWADGAATAAILADMYDLLNQLNNNLAARGSGHRARAVKPYPRPWATPQKGSKRIGRDPIPISEFEKWWNGE